MSNRLRAARATALAVLLALAACAGASGEAADLASTPENERPDDVTTTVPREDPTTTHGGDSPASAPANADPPEVTDPSRDATPSTATPGTSATDSSRRPATSETDSSPPRSTFETDPAAGDDDPATTVGRSSEPTIAEEFAEALDGLRVVHHGTAVPDGVRDRVARLALLVGRAPDPDAVVLGTQLLVADVRSLEQLAAEMLRSEEYLARQGPAPRTNEGFLASLYRDVLGREADGAEIASWSRAIEQGVAREEVAAIVTDSDESIDRTATAPVASAAVAVDGVARRNSDAVLRLYLGLLQRFPSDEELAAAVNRRADVGVAGVAAGILTSGEYARRRPNSTPAATIEGLYLDLLGRPADASGRANWLGQLENGRPLPEIAATISSSPEAVMHTLTTGPGGDRPGTAGTDDVAPSGILAVGDSIMLSAADSLRAAVPGVSVNARENRQWAEGLAVVRALDGGSGIPPTVIVHLGTNGEVTPARCDEMMDSLEGSRVLLVNVHVPRPWEAPTNQTLTDCAERRGAEIVDWFAIADDDVLAPDGYHLRPEGYGVFAAALAAAL